MSRELTGSKYLRVTTDIGTMNASAASLHDPEKVSDDQLRAALRDLSVDNVTTVLTAIIEDKSVKKPVRRQAVARVVNHQPHPTKHFEAFKLWNIEMISATGYNDPQKSIPMVSLNFLYTSFLMAFIGFTFESGFSAFVFIFPVISWLLMGITLVLIDKNVRKKVKALDHERHHLTLCDFTQKKHQEKIESLRQQQDHHREQIKLLDASLDDEDANVVSLLQTKQDFADAKAHISSYETNMTKALTRPAFNDVTVPAVNTMIKQLRKCRSLAQDVDSGSVSAREFADAVGELWVDVAAAEQAAKRIAWSQVSDEEQKDLKLALQLVSQANDSGNTDELRANLYSRLRTVVQRLDSRGVTMPEPMILELESRSAKEITVS